MRKIITIITIALSLTLNITAGATGWQTEIPGVLEVDLIANTRYRIDLFKNGENIDLTTTLSKSDEDSVYVHQFMPYIIERKGNGSYTFAVTVLDDYGEVVSTSEQSEPFEYKTPEKTLTAINELKFEGGYLYFIPSSEEECAGYSVEYTTVYGDNTSMSFRTDYYIGNRINEFEKADNYLRLDLEKIYDKFNQAVNRNTERNSEKYNPEIAKLGVRVSVHPKNVLEYKSSTSNYITGSENVFEKETKGSMRVDVSKYGKKAEDVIVLEIGKTYASVFGKEVTNDVAPLALNGRTMLPIRFVAEALGASVGWDADTQTITITNENTTILLVINETVAIVNGEKKELDAAPFVDTARTYMPVRFIAENLGAGVLWDDETKSVIIFQ